jgi:tRNA (guanine-N7-)-methyltransferase
MIFALEDEAPIALDQLPNWSLRFGQAAQRLELEIGSGHGGFALEFGRRHPERALVAIEQRKKFAADVAMRADRRGLGNLLVLQGDARLLAPRLFRASSLAAIHVHFPDPWWKRRHHRRRIVDDNMSGLLFRLLAPKGELDLRTDVERYAVDALARLEPLGFVNRAGAGRFAERQPEEIPSTREKRYLASGQRIWRIQLVKPADAALPARAAKLYPFSDSTR